MANTQYQVQFLTGSKAGYQQIQQKDAYTFYLCTDSNELFLGEELLNNASDLNAAISRIAANENAIAALQGAVTTLNGDAQTEGSVAKAISDAIADVIDGAPATFDTLKELADWIEEHSGDAAEIIASLNALKALVGDALPAGATATNVIDYIEEIKYNPFDTEVPSDVIIIPEEAFSGSRTLSTVSFQRAIAVERKAFWDCETLTAASLPLVRNIGEKAFESCIMLQSIDIPMADYVGRDAYAMCMFAETLNAPLLRIVEYGAFQNTNIATIDLPSCEFIGEAGFGGSFMATEVNLPVCREIDDQAFISSGLLEEITLPAIQKLGSLVFSGCSKLKDVYIPTDWVPECDFDVFKNTPMDTADSVTGEIEGKIYVQGRLIDAFKTAEGWSTYEDCIVAIPGTEVAPAELPPAGVADAGKVLKVNAQGEWAKGDDNSTIYWQTFI